MLEDDVDVGAAMQQWLEAGGHTVHHFISGKAIVREAARESFDLFLLDWHVPDLSGEEVLKWLRPVVTPNRISLPRLPRERTIT
jgi:two-component system response regulator RegX3